MRSSVSTHPSVYALVAPNDLPNGGYHFSEDEVKFCVSGGGGFVHACASVRKLLPLHRWGLGFRV